MPTAQPSARKLPVADFPALQSDLSLPPAPRAQANAGFNAAPFLLRSTAMATITFWRRGTLTCELVLDDGFRELRLTDGDQLILSQRLLADDDGSALARLWRTSYGDRRGAEPAPGL